MAMILKDIGEIWRRLFDHRPFLSGEIKFFLREFEEKRCDRELDRLYRTFEDVTEIREERIDTMVTASACHLVSLHASVVDCIEKCNKILEREHFFRSDSTENRNGALRKAE